MLEKEADPGPEGAEPGRDYQLAPEPVTTTAGGAAGGTADDAAGPVAGMAERLERIADPAARAAAFDLVRAVLAWHAEGLRQMTAALAAEADGGRRLAAIAARPQVASLLLLHGLHPEGLADRVCRGLETIASLAAARRGRLELIETLGERVRLRWRGEGAAPARRTIELAVWTAAPDVSEILIENGAERPDFIPLETLG